MGLEKLDISFKNCYGINNLEFEFDFNRRGSRRSNVYAIYASNGVMKSSFAEIFRNLSIGDKPKDRIFPERRTSCRVKDQNGDLIKKEQIYVIDPYDSSFASDKISLLVAKKDLKKKYDSIHYNIDKTKSELIDNLINLSHINDSNLIERTILFAFEEDDILSCLENLENGISSLNNDEFSKFSYKDIFNQKVIEFLKNENNKKLLAEYIDKYNELIDKSEYLKRDLFTHNNASNVSKNLKSNGFFLADHSVLLKSHSGEKLIKSEKDFDKIINSEKERIFSNKELLAKFDNFDKAITRNEDLRKFRLLLERNKELIPELMDLSELNKKLWLSYLKKEEKIYFELINKYKLGKKEIEEIILEAKTEISDWDLVISKFNDRFFVPFKIEIVNREDVILKGEVETLEFIFEDYKGKKSTTRSEIQPILSTGEKKALYILDLIYEIESRKKVREETVFIIDDIADSFDYRNKYAILEYLMDISREDFFYEIILTHNFDFFRTINSRFVPYYNCFMAEKDKSGIHLKKINNSSEIQRPFKDWIKNLSEVEHYSVAIIPFLRNIIEYTRDTSDLNYSMLTSMLHHKETTGNLKISDLEFILKDEFNQPDLELKKKDEKIIDRISDFSDGFSNLNDLNLDQKIVLSIGIRLLAEQLMIKLINDPDFVKNIQSNQTAKLFAKYKELPDSDNDTIKLLEKVNLMTPENIHLNSFMYEPIIDISSDHLSQLYHDLKDLI